MTGGDRAGYMQIAGMVDADFIGPSTKSTDYTTCTWAHGWSKIEILSSAAIFAGVTAPGLSGSTNLTSATTFPQFWTLACSRITAIKFTSETSGFMAIAYRRILL